MPNGFIREKNFCRSFLVTFTVTGGTVIWLTRMSNELAFQNGDRLFSVYHTNAGAKFWIITQADLSATTVLPPEDYWKGNLS